VDPDPWARKMKYKLQVFKNFFYGFLELFLQIFLCGSGSALDPDSKFCGSGSGLRKNAGSGSGLNQSGSTTLKKTNFFLYRAENTSADLRSEAHTLLQCYFSGCKILKTM
jgi:hypothetical protein